MKLLPFKTISCYVVHKNEMCDYLFIIVKIKHEGQIWPCKLRCLYMDYLAKDKYNMELDIFLFEFCYVI